MNKKVIQSCCAEGFKESEAYGAYKIFFGTLVSDSRIKIINFLRAGKKNVTQIAKEVGMDQTHVSHDLARLRGCGFVSSEVVGKFRYYKLNEKTILPMMNLIDEHMAGNCVHILRKIKGEEK
ncbi:Bacterial regulatory protein, arsR family [uncultured archaeon]|nr:Bacterial regulatory protein, arsR family [uncultured archaeon]